MFDKFSHDEFFFVSRIRKNTLVKVMEEYEVPSGGSILQDQMVVLGGKNGYLTDPYRLVEVTDTQENRLRIITNRFDLSAEAISQMYRSRWEIELFFKQLKQQTTIKKFFSRDEDGLKTRSILLWLHNFSPIWSNWKHNLFSLAWQSNATYSLPYGKLVNFGRQGYGETDRIKMNGSLTQVEEMKINWYSS